MPKISENLAALFSNQLSHPNLILSLKINPCSITFKKMYPSLNLTLFQLLSYLRSWHRVEDSARDPNDGDHHEHTPGIRQHDSFSNSMSSPSYLSWLLYYLNYKLVNKLCMIFTISSTIKHNLPSKIKIRKLIFHCSNRHLEYLNHFMLKPKQVLLLISKYDPLTLSPSGEQGLLL